MKKILLSIAFALLGFSSSFAAKANNGITQVTLTDGTIVSVRLYGDENFHYYALLDGTPLQMTANGKYEKITIEELQAKQSVSLYSTARASSMGTVTPMYFPHTGSPRALVILVQFKDVKFQSADPIATFNHYLNAEAGESWPTANENTYHTNYKNYGSVRQYFTDCSNGQFAPQFDVVGPVTVSQNSDYYGKDGTNNSTDPNFHQMISEACDLIDGQVNFADYDSNNDGYVDLVYIIYAGYSQSVSGNSPDCLWPKAGTYNFTSQYDGKKIRRFGINNELNATPAAAAKLGKPVLNGIGLFCHEFSHTMGMPDLYVTNSKLPAYTANNQSPESWDLMDAGEYTNDGYCPTPYSPWEKMMMGWIEPENLEANKAQQLSLEPYDVNSKAYKIDADVDENNFTINTNYDGTVNEATKQQLFNRAKGEYLLLQNIRKTGWYQHLEGEGLLVWRIDYADLATVKLGDYPNNQIGIPRVMIVPADGLVINANNVKSKEENNAYLASLTHDTYPLIGMGEDGADVNFLKEVKLNWSTQTSRPIYNIALDNNTGNITFDYLKDFTTGIDSPITNVEADKDANIYTLDGRYLGTDASKLGKGVYVIGKKKVVIK